MKKTLLFRADGNTKTGLGHVYRLLGLFEMFRETYHCIFITTINTPETIFSDRYEVLRVPSDVSISEEPNWLKTQFSSYEVILICDGYQFVSQYQKSIKENGFLMVYIDDLMSEHLYADLVINHSPEIDASHFQKETYTKLALGTQYAMLRPEFLEQLQKERKQVEQKNVFVCFGGSDPYNLSYKVAKAVLEFEEVENIWIVLGASYQNEELIELQKSADDKISLLRNLSAQELLDMMLRSLFAIVPTSTILYELCCANTVCLSGYYVENQRRIHDGFLKNGAIYSMKDISKFESENFVKYIQELFSKEDHKVQLENQRKMFDANIKSRYLKLIEELC